MIISSLNFSLFSVKELVQAFQIVHPCHGLPCLPPLHFLMGGLEWGKVSLKVTSLFPGKVSPSWETRVDLGKLLCCNSQRCFTSQGHAAAPMPICYLTEKIAEPWCREVGYGLNGFK